MVAPPELALDPDIRTWVVYPILVVMILLGLLRHYASVVMAPDPPRLATDAERKEQAYLALGKALVSTNFNVPKKDLSAQVAYLAPKFRAGDYITADHQKPPAAGPLMPMGDPKNMDMMLAGVKNQVMTYVPQTLTMSWVSTFFGGVIVMKLPFPLTLRFKEMLQSGIATPDLDVRWVSSISWYILLLIGLSSVYALILGSDNAAAQASNQGQDQNIMSMGMAAPGTDFKKLFAAQADSLELIEHKYVLDGVEERVLKL